jgi:hypothetical protein
MPLNLQAYGMTAENNLPVYYGMYCCCRIQHAFVFSVTGILKFMDLFSATYPLQKSFFKTCQNYNQRILSKNMSVGITVLVFRFEVEKHNAPADV